MHGLTDIFHFQIQITGLQKFCAPLVQLVSFDSLQVRNFSLLVQGQVYTCSAKEMIQEIYEDNSEILFFMKTNFVGTW